MISQKPQPENALALPPIPLSPDAALEQIMGTVKVAYYASFDVKNPLAKSAVFSALSGDSAEIKDVVNKTIKVWGYIVRPSDPKLTRDGELQVYPISLLLCSDGQVYRSGSRGVLQTLRLLEAERGSVIWTPPEDCVVVMKNLGGDPPKTWIYLSRISKE